MSTWTARVYWTANGVAVSVFVPVGGKMVGGLATQTMFPDEDTAWAWLDEQFCLMYRA